MLILPLGAAAQEAPATGRGLEAEDFIYYRAIDLPAGRAREPLRGSGGFSEVSGIGPAGTMLVLAHLTARGVTTRDVASTSTGPLRPSIAGNLLCAAAGKLYINSWGHLLVVDLSTGEVQQLFTAPAIAGHGSTIYAIPDSTPYRLLAIDAASQSATALVDIPPAQMSPSIRQLLVSPDGRYIAGLAPTMINGRGNGGFGPAKLVLIDLANDTAVTLLDPIPYVRPTTTGPNRLIPLAWQDNQTLLTITNDPRPAAGVPAARSSAAAGPGLPAAILTSIDIASGHVTRICPLPEGASNAAFDGPTATSELAILPTEPAGLRAAFDGATGSLRAGPTRFGRFQLAGNAGGRGPRQILVEGRVISPELVPVSQPVLSPGGSRVLYSFSERVEGRSVHRLHVYDALSHTDLVIGDAAAGAPAAWVAAADLIRPATIPAAPAGYEPLAGQPFPVDAKR
jgi:hypothetical protein